MKTLYDLIGAIADDDAEALKQAFREAVKAHHPDLHPDDPDAPSRFRQIVAASVLLRDAKKRATNDRIRELERQQFQLTLECDQLRSKVERQQLRSKRIRTTVAVAVVGVLAGGYVLFASLPTTTIVAIEKDKHPATTGASVKSTATIVTAAQRTENTPVKDDIDDAGEPVERVAGLLMGSADPADSGEPRDKHDDAEVAEGVSKPNADAYAISHDTQVIVAQVIARPGSAAGHVTNEANLYRERGIAAYRSGDFLGAIGNFDAAIRLNRDDARSYNVRGNVWDELGVSERALADYDTAVRIDPNNPAVFHDRAILWQRKGALDKALLDFDRAIRFNFADANVYCDRGLVWYQKGRHDRAIADFDQAIKLNPDFAPAYINRGVILHSNGEFTVAFANGRAIRVDPSIFDVTKRTNVRP